MYRKVTNPLAIQSQKQICETMIRLLKTIPFDDITITLLCQEAHLVRKTFYRNFETKEDVLICMLDYHLLDYIEELPRHINTLTDLVEHFFQYWNLNYDYLKTLQENALFYLLNRLYLHYMEEINLILKNSTIELFHTESEYSYTFYYGGLCNMLALWVSHECKESFHDFTSIILNI